MVAGSAVCATSARTTGTTARSPRPMSTRRRAEGSGRCVIRAGDGATCLRIGAGPHAQASARVVG
eukprot:11184989-Lingulodinium_polyedra.AAC.1